MKFAAIDIGSNAIRLQVSVVIHTRGELTFKKIEYVRFPLRLGHDVFKTGKISPLKYKKFKKLMRAFKILIELYEVDDYMACATSALRESENGAAIVREIEEEIKLKIQIIDGKREALLINNVITSFLQTKRNYLHIDVGGGSTELNIYKSGKKVAAQSFKIGSVRRLDHFDSPQVWGSMKRWIQEKTKELKGPLTAVGTGGNINKLYELAQRKAEDKLSLGRLKETANMISELTMEERINDLQLNPDRADVIIPASEIYSQVMEWAGANFIIVPSVGLKDGMMLWLYEQHLEKEKMNFN
ncbi:phosphatase [Fulvivirga sedimenti]|uniref:Phosphatase n=1 Tax=Fulvivirga sedimenti TaxID=2879465 RepID=A0A9X1KUD4_9BACT|nr:phosphatase [Fulvivirga sedimenti]MCA6073383.1 phosphatase [Fulvivirga sedimenti]